jgi:O-antigen ligase
MVNTYTYLRNRFLKISNLERNNEVFVFLIAFILLAIPLKYIVGSISIILFILAAFVNFRRKNLSFSKSLLIPVAFYLLMGLSLFWTREFKLSMAGLQKELIFLLVPIAFAVMPKLTVPQRYKIVGLFSYGMVLFCVFYLAKAVFKFISTREISVFFYHELVTLDVNAIYVSVFTSFALFYFIDRKNKDNLTRIIIGFLTIMVFLLSSKSIIFIDFILIICYYSFFSDVPKSVRFLTVTAVGGFLFFSLFFVDEVRDRFLLEFETAFVDNTVNAKIGNENEIVYNVSLQQAWNDKQFKDNQFFPGTALRVYQFRIFTELMREESVVLTGFGLEASQDQIQKKATQYNLYDGYGDFNFHNQYVQSFAELGFFGFLLLISMLYITIKKACQHKDFLQITFGITMIVLFLTESFFCRQRGITFFVVLYCLFNSFVPKTQS